MPAVLAAVAARLTSAVSVACCFCAADAVKCGADDAASVARAFTTWVETRYIWVL